MDLRFPNYEKCKIVDGVPEGWKYRSVREFGEVITGKTPSTSKLTIMAVIFHLLQYQICMERYIH